MDPTVEEVAAGLFAVERELDRLSRLLGWDAEVARAAIRAARHFAGRARREVEREARECVAA